jgi:DNA-binding MarR family transcriptional regulator
VSVTRPEQLTAALHRFGLERDRLRAALAQALGTAEADLDALEYLEADGPMTQRQLGERLLLSSGGVTVLVDRLERAGWVARRRHRSDRRFTVLELTKEALAATPEPLAVYHAALVRAARRIDPPLRAELVGFLAAATQDAADATARLRATPRARPQSRAPH